MTVTLPLLTLDARIDRYEIIMRRTLTTALDLRNADARFVVRLWDGMDGCWTDLNDAPLDAGAALRLWEERTDFGTQKVAFTEIDYFRIFPWETQMLYADGFEMFRDPDPESS